MTTNNEKFSRDEECNISFDSKKHGNIVRLVSPAQAELLDLVEPLDGGNIIKSLKQIHYLASYCTTGIEIDSEFISHLAVVDVLIEAIRDIKAEEHSNPLFSYMLRTKIEKPVAEISDNSGRATSNEEGKIIPLHNEPIIEENNADPKFPEVNQVVQEFYDYKMKLDVKKGTKEHYSTFYNHVNRFLKEYSINTINQINQGLILEFTKYLPNKGVNHPTNIKRIINLLFDAFRFAYVNGRIENNPIERLTLPKLKKRVKEQIKLSKKEMKQLILTPIKAKSLERAKNMFLFQCYTGLAYADLMGFKDSQIIEREGHTLIIGNRLKSSEKYIIPFSINAKQYWDALGQKITPITNQVYNRFLKEIAEKCQVHTKLTTHVARKTFGQIMLDDGYSIEAVSRMLGHADIRTTQSYYVKAGENLILNEMIKGKKNGS